MPASLFGSRSCVLATLLQVCAAASLPHPARAEGDREQARPTPGASTAGDPVEGGPYGELIEAALREYRAHRFHEALSLFAKAHAVLPNARTLRGLGLVEFELRNYVESAALLERALAEPKRALTGGLRSETEQLWRRAEGFLARFELHSEQALTVHVDGVQREQAQGEPLAVAVGDHLLEFSAPGYVSERRVVRVRGGEREPLQVALQPQPALAPADPHGAALASRSAPGKTTLGARTDRARASTAPSVGSAGADLSPAAAARSQPDDEARSMFQLSPQPAHDDRRPLYKNKWLWAGVIVATAAAAVGLGFGLTADRGRTRDPISAPPIASRSGP
jgi:tetratricopeptide (TPR) repeat protein